MGRIAGWLLTTTAMLVASTAMAAGQGVGPISGIIETADCATHVLVMATPGGTELFSVAADARVHVAGSPATFCSLSRYVGSPATVTGAGANGRRTIGSVEVFTPVPVRRLTPP